VGMASAKGQGEGWELGLICCELMVDEMLARVTFFLNRWDAEVIFSHLPPIPPQPQTILVIYALPTILLLLPLPHFPASLTIPIPTTPIHPSFTHPIIIPRTILPVVITSSTRQITCITSNRGNSLLSLSFIALSFSLFSQLVYSAPKGLLSTSTTTTTTNGPNANGTKKIGSISIQLTLPQPPLLPWGIYFIHPECTPTSLLSLVIFFFFCCLCYFCLCAEYEQCSLTLSLPICFCFVL
jgi:hypothetical protein